MKGNFKIEFILQWDKSLGKEFDFEIVQVKEDRVKAVKRLFMANGVDADEFTKRFIKKVKDIK